MYGVPDAKSIGYTQLVTLDLSTVTPSLAGPKRPQDRIELGDVKNTYTRLYSEQSAAGFNQPPETMHQVFTTSAGTTVKNGHRSAERRVGKECVSTRRSWWSPSPLNTNHQ